ncbi:hypothetical protein [Dechloromonas sp. A34]|uniref:hypothetical protein n=1 Tax=Dechloromonas sp. A34 TaxID=447588 RepID=UPI0022496475|nr:hypothetical protein [Dechloromonas sp. A34]
MSLRPLLIAPTGDHILSNLLSLSSAYFAADLGFSEPPAHLREIPFVAPLLRFPTGIYRPAMG